MENRPDEVAAQGRSDVQSVGDKPDPGQPLLSDSTRLLNSIAAIWPASSACLATAN